MNRFCQLVQTTLHAHALRAKSLPATSYLRTFQLSSNDLVPVEKTPEKDNEKNAFKQNKLKASPKITLTGQNQSVSVTSLDDAQKLAKRRDLHLLLVQELDTKTQRPVYKLVTPSELLAEELKDLKVVGKSGEGKHAPHKKSEKNLTIGSRISDHDLASRQKNICKWLVKQHEVRILIQGGPDDMPKMERISKAIEQSIKEPELLGKVQQKRAKGSHIKFVIVPMPPPLPIGTPDTEATIRSKTTAPIISSTSSSSS